MRFLFLGWLLLNATFARAQTDNKALQLILPQQPDWNVLNEGTPLQFQLQASGANTDSATYAIAQGRVEGMMLDSTGFFKWTPGYDLADRIKTIRPVQVMFEVRNRRGETASQTVTFRVQHINRPPVVDDLRPFYVRARSQNTYKIDGNVVRDEDGDPLVFAAVAETLPEGAKLTSAGEVMWTPSQNQFNQLKAKPTYIEFWAEDQPAKTRTKGRMRVDVTAMDLPPEITLVPKDSTYQVRENATLNLKFYLADPNGDDDINTFEFLSTDPNVAKSALVKRTNNQYEFIWQPGYEFVRDPLDSLRVQLTFYALDKTRNRAERSVFVTVRNTVNEEEKDRYAYAQYRQALVQAWNLVEQLSEKEEELKRDYRRAKKGKRNRSMASASLGAVTGISPAISSGNPANQRLISAVGGTAVLTMGTLEATEVVGKPMKDLLDRYNYVLGKKAELQNKGEVFARDFALKSTRRSNDFIKKLDDFRNSMNIAGLVALELDAGWQNKKEATDKAIKRTFKDYAEYDAP